MEGRVMELGTIQFKGWEGGMVAKKLKAILCFL